MVDTGSIFISYATPDRDRVRPFCDYLKECGFDVWVDFERLLPGHKWELEIQRALARADFVIIFISNNSVTRRGYVQRELRIALDQSSYKLDDDTYIIPILLDDDVSVPDKIGSVHYIAASCPDCRKLIRDAILEQTAKLDAQRRIIQQKGDLTWEKYQLRESWDGLPGYEVALQFIELKSKTRQDIQQVGEYIKGQFLERLLVHRQFQFDQMPKAYNIDQVKALRTNTYDAICGDPTIVGSVLSVPYKIYWYGAGAAHPNSLFQVFNFALQPVTLLPKLATLFGHAPAALVALQKNVRSSLANILHEDGKPLLDPEWIERGTNDWADFPEHEFTSDGVRLLFAPYHVGAYALGAQIVTVPYRQVVGLMLPQYVNLLGLNR